MYFHPITRLKLAVFLYWDVRLAWSAKAVGGVLALSNRLTFLIFAMLGRSKHGRREPWARSSLPGEPCMIHQQLLRPLQGNRKNRYLLLNRPLLWWKCSSGWLKPRSWMIHLSWCNNAALLLSATALVLRACLDIYFLFESTHPINKTADMTVVSDEHEHIDCPWNESCQHRWSSKCRQISGIKTNSEIQVRISICVGLK